MNEIIDAQVVETTPASAAPAVEAKTEVSLSDRLAKATTEFESVKAQLRQVEEQAINNQKQLQTAKDRLMTRGLELQGQIGLLNDVLGIKPAAPAAQ